MAFKVELTIRGLCAFIPSESLQFREPGEPAEPNQRIHGMTVLVMDARQPQVIPSRAPNPSPELPESWEVCGHLPLLRYPQLAKDKLNSFFLLDGHRIEISDVDTGPDPESSLEIDRSFKNWIPMGLALSGQVGAGSSVRVDPRFLSPVLPTGIAGRLDLKAGTVKASRSLGTWDFVPPIPIQDPADFKFEAEVQVSIPIAKDQAVLRMIDRAGVSIEKVLKPKEINPAGNSSVNLLLSNLCFEDEEHRLRPRIEEDFAVFYSLYTGYNGVLRVPRLLAQGGGSGAVKGTANESPSCTGMRTG
jgi:hypothetical protein